MIKHPLSSQKRHRAGRGGDYEGRSPVYIYPHPQIYMESRVVDTQGNQLGKGIGVGLCGLGICAAAAYTGDIAYMIGFFPLIFITLFF